MEQITRRDGVLYYGEQVCRNADESYRRFRSDYHGFLGKRAYHRLNRYGSRVERIPDNGFIFSDYRQSPVVTVHCPVYLMGLVKGSYCKMVGAWDLPEGMDEDTFFAWLDWAFQKGSGGIRLRSKWGVGRNSRRSKVRYR